MSAAAKCLRCPVAPGDECRRDLFPFFCQWAEGGNRTHLQHIVNRSAIAAGMPPEATAPAPGEAAPPAIPVVESMRRLALARACPSRTAPQCGCAGMATCLEGKGRDGQVSLAECVSCVVGPA